MQNPGIRNPSQINKTFNTASHFLNNRRGTIRPSYSLHGRSGTIHLGELFKDHPWDKDLVGITVQVYKGESAFDESLTLTEETATVYQVLCPLEDVPFIYGVGLNYKRHAAESGRALPKYPRTFVKFPDALTGPYDDVHVPPAAVDVNYEVCWFVRKPFVYSH